MYEKLTCPRCGGHSIRRSPHTFLDTNVIGIRPLASWCCTACGEACNDPGSHFEVQPILDVVVGFTVLAATLAMMISLL